MLSSSKQRFALLAAALLLVPSAADAQSDVQQLQSGGVLRTAWKALEAGDPRRAEMLFIQQQRLYSGFKQHTYYVDSTRGIVIAALFARDDARASREWAFIRDSAPDAWVVAESRADRLAASGRWKDAYRAYRDESVDNSMVGPVPHAHDPIVSDGVEHVLRGDFRGAIGIWQKPSTAGGPYDVTDVQTALIGIAQAQQGAWDSAASTWVAAARQGRAVPEIDALYSGNLTALALLVRYRDRYHRGPHAYHV